MNFVPPQHPTWLLVGNPNVGKSAVFGRLTGYYAHVANYPGTTVEISRGELRGGGGSVLDLPGTNSLFSVSDADRVTRDAILDRIDDNTVALLQVADAKNLRRALFLTLQLTELEFPVALVLNMMDEAEKAGVQIDFHRLKNLLGIEVSGAVAIRGEGIEPFLSRNKSFSRGLVSVRYSDEIEKAVEQLVALFPSNLAGRRGRALLLLGGNGSLSDRARAWLGENVEKARTVVDTLHRLLGPALLAEIVRCRYEWIDKTLAEVLRKDERPTGSWVHKITATMTHPVLGFPFALLVLYALYLFVGVLGAGTAVNFLENTVFGQYLVPLSERLLRFILPASMEPFLIGSSGLLIGEYGLISMALSYSVAIVLPIIGFFFIAFSILEDSGYLPRLAVMLHRFFRSFGLNGQAVMPVVLGFGCDTMATITTRTLASRKERIIVTFLLALAVPCSAQLGVILGLLAGLSWSAMLWWCGTLLTVLVVTGSLLGKMVPGYGSDFILELPPLRRPIIKNIVLKTAARIEWYLKEAVPLFFLGTFLLWLLDRFTLLARIQEWASPLVVGWLNLPSRATEAFLIGFLRRDYGAAGLYDIFQPILSGGLKTPNVEVQIVVATITMTLFIPCIANFFVIVKEHGLKIAAAMATAIFPLAFLVGGIVDRLMRALWL